MQKVLVVEDDPIQRCLVAEFFTMQFNAEIIEAENGIAGLEAVRQFGNEIVYIVTDIEMPEMDGIEFLRELTATGYQGRLAVISGVSKDLLGRIESIVNFHGFNFDGVCSKPVTLENLYNLVTVPETSIKRPLKQQQKQPTQDDVIAGLEKGEIVPYYQPKVSVADGQIIGAEALARWNHPEFGLISPAVFIPMIERLGKTRELTFTILKTALEDLQSWQTNGLNLRVAINITSNEVDNLALPNQIRDTLNHHSVKPSQLVLEVTENTTLELCATSLEVLTRIRLMGIDVAIDDFGTGYANMKTLQDFPYSELKIDQSFIRSAISNNFSHESVKASITLGREKNMRILAEGVETIADWKYIEAAGVDEVQGYLIAKPMPNDDFISFCMENSDGIKIDKAA